MGYSLTGRGGADDEPGVGADLATYTGPMLCFFVALRPSGRGARVRAQLILRRWFPNKEQAVEFHIEHGGILPPRGFMACLGMSLPCGRIAPGNLELERMVEAMFNKP
jgi:hypothetical protein